MEMTIYRSMLQKKVWELRLDWFVPVEADCWVVGDPS